MAIYGEFVYIEDDVTEEKINEAKKVILDRLINVFVEKAKRDDFWIVKDGTTGPYPLNIPTVGAKFILPTVEEG